MTLPSVSDQLLVDARWCRASLSDLDTTFEGVMKRVKAQTAWSGQRIQTIVEEAVAEATLEVHG